MGRPIRIIILMALVYALIGGSPVNEFDLGKEIGNCFHGGCDVVSDQNRRIDGGIRSKAESLFGPARDAFIQAMTELFDKKLNPFPDRILRSPLRVGVDVWPVSLSSPGLKFV
jgi:hypothetical protein